MIDWEYLIEKYGQAETPHKFEEIALEYVKDVYPQYSWHPTQRTRDGNKDAQRKEVYFGEDSSYDVWEESKFKGTGRALRRQDIDPTVLSGLIQGNVRLIVFVTNASIPGSLLDRAILGARIKGMKVSCVLEDQLASWLYLRSDIYRKYWDSLELTISETEKVVWIQSSTFLDLVSNDFKPFNTRKVMLVGNIYLLTVSISSNTKLRAELIMSDDFPFEQVNHPNYDAPSRLMLECGLSTFAILVKAKHAFSGCINLKFNIDGKQYSRVTQEIEIIAGASAKIVYAQQLQLVEKIRNRIDAIQIASGNIIALYAGSGMGKSFVLRNIQESFGLKRDMTTVEFESDKNALTNYLLLCRIVLFLYYGNIFWERSTWTKDELNEKKEYAIRANNRELFDDATLGSIFDGCFDAGVAKDVVEQLMRRRRANHVILHTKALLTGKILLIDDFQYLNKKQADFLYQIINDFNQYKSDSIVVISATKGRFLDETVEDSFLKITPNIFELSGLTSNDMAQTLGSCFHISPMALRRIAPKILSSNPLLTSEIIRILQDELENHVGNALEMITTYSASKGKSLILKNRFVDVKDQFYLLDILYRFRKGLPLEVIFGFCGFINHKMHNDLDFLISRNLINIRGNVVFPFHDYYIRSYIQLRNDAFYNETVGQFLCYLLSLGDNGEVFDTDHVLAMLIDCGEKYLHLYENKLKERIHYYMQTTQFGTALHYCSCYYRVIAKNDPHSYSRDDFRYLFSYAYCLVHCGDQALANQLLETIYTYATEDLPEKYAAGSELLSQNFWALKLDGMIETSLLIQSGAEHLLRTNNLTNIEKARIEHAYDTCFNRRMVTYLLQDQRQRARDTYIDRLKLLSQKYHGNEFRSQAATLIMDYARGVSFFTPQKAKKLFEIAYSFFSCNREIHYRRIMLCKIDYIVLKCITGDIDAFWEMDAIINSLLQGGFYSEYFKAILKRCACRTVFLSEVASDYGNERDQATCGAQTYEDALEEISNALIESGLQPEERDLFLLKNLLAYFAIRNHQIDKATEYLVEVDAYVKQAGKSYRSVVAHNLKYMNSITRIAWCTSEKFFDPGTYMLDCRFW